MNLRLLAVTPIVTAALLVSACTASNTTSTASSPAQAAANPAPAATVTVTAAPAQAVPPPATAGPRWEDTVAEVRSGVGLIKVQTCGGGSTGTGFLVGPSLMMTAAHVVTDAALIVVQVAGSDVSATVLGLDEGLDVALIRLSAPVHGHLFAIAASPPATGQDVDALGFPLGEGFTSTRGSVSGLDRSGRTEMGPVSNLIQTDTAVNPGNSGGPLITADGRVVGVVSARRLTANGQTLIGTAFAASMVTGWPVATKWRDRNQAIPAVSCGARKSSSGSLLATYVYAPQPDASDVASTLYRHGEAINHADYALAFSLLSSNLRGRNDSVEGWSSGLKSSYWVALAVDNLVRSGPTLTADVRLRTTQLPEDGPDNQTCSNWTIRYGMVLEGGIWHIDSATTPWGPPQPC